MDEIVENKIRQKRKLILKDETESDICSEKSNQNKDHDKIGEKIIYERPIQLNHVQSFIANISAPKSLDEMLDIIEYDDIMNVEKPLIEDETTWTSPRWSKMGDIVFFMHTKTSNSTLTALRTELDNNKNNYDKTTYYELMEWIYKGLRFHSMYGGKIYAVGVTTSSPEIYESSGMHWNSRVYSDIDVHVLDVPIDISEFNDFIMVSRQSSITGVFGKEFDKLRDIILKYNSLPNFFTEANATPIPLSKINDTNWMQINNEYRRSFGLEAQFRTYYVDYLLRSIGDKKTFYKECRCTKPTISPSFMDNVILFEGKYLPVEVKLSVTIENNIKAQVAKYCDNDKIVLTDNKIITDISKVYSNRVMVIDSDNIYIYKYELDEIENVYNLDDLKTGEKLFKLKTIIKNNLLF